MLHTPLHTNLCRQELPQSRRDYESYLMKLVSLLTSLSCCWILGEQRRKQTAVTHLRQHIAHVHLIVRIIFKHSSLPRSNTLATAQYISFWRVQMNFSALFRQLLASPTCIKHAKQLTHYESLHTRKSLASSLSRWDLRRRF